MPSLLNSAQVSVGVGINFRASTWARRRVHTFDLYRECPSNNMQILGVLNRCYLVSFFRIVLL